MNITSDKLYFDSHASTEIDPIVLKAMHTADRELFGNPHSDDHSFGWNAGKSVESARQNLANLINADNDEIIFTSGATEANNLALLGYARGYSHANQSDVRKTLIVSPIEHKCILGASNALRNERWIVKSAPVCKDGIVNLHQLEKIIDEDTKLVSIMAVNNEVGAIQPIEEISSLCSAAGAIFHCDAAQAPLAIDIDVLSTDIDMLSLSSHKMHGPKGIGALFVRREIINTLQPLMHGGGQELGLRPGTLAPSLVVGFGIAAELAGSDARHVQRETVKNKRNLLMKLLQEKHPTCAFNGPISARHPGCVNVRYEGIDAGRLIGKLQPILAISSGSACTTGIPEPSHVLTAMGLSAEPAESSVRIGISRFTDEADIYHAAELINNAVSDCYQTDRELVSP